MIPGAHIVMPPFVPAQVESGRRFVYNRVLFPDDQQIRYFSIQMSANTTIERKSNVKKLFSRFVFACVAVIIEVLFVVQVTYLYAGYPTLIDIIIRILALFLTLGIFSQYRTAAMKIPWIILIMGFPVFGVVLYLMAGLNGTTKKMRGRFEKVDAALLPLLHQEESVRLELEKQDPLLSNLSRYIMNYAGYPVYRNTELTFFPETGPALKAQLEALEKAEKFIFLEYHAIENKQIWKPIQEILEKKVQEGLDVRVFYDDVGSVYFVKKDFAKMLEEKGIKVKVFNTIRPWLRLFLNNRDHRKLTIIDGKTGFTGGYNLADKYFDLANLRGHWKDCGMRLTGEAVRSMTATFLEMWNAAQNKDEDRDRDYSAFLPAYTPALPAKGAFVQPYADSPLDNEHIGENVYISLAEMARDYIYFVTPYLIITDEMNYALGMAAKRGVDVRIVTPAIPDKKTVFQVTRSYYAGLVRNGVRIYEYTPGFSHSKLCVSDDHTATCGTINMDFRSLYHHFENGCLVRDEEFAASIRQDLEEMFSVSREVTEDYRTGRSRSLRLGQLVLRFFAPLM